MIEIHLPDGRVLRFPDGTPESVVRHQVETMAGGPSAPAHHDLSGLGSGIAAAGGEPGLGRVGKLADVGAPEDVEDPGYFTTARKAFGGALGLPIAGGLETLRDFRQAHPVLGTALSGLPGMGMGLADLTPEGFTESVRGDLDKTKEDYLYHHTQDPIRSTLPLAAEFAGNLVPVGIGAGAGKVGMEAIGAAAPSLGRAVAASASSIGAGALEGGVLGNVSAYGTDPASRTKATVLGATLGGLGGVLGGFHAARGMGGLADDAARAREAITPLPETPPLVSAAKPKVGAEEVRIYLESRNGIAEMVEPMRATLPPEIFDQVLKKALTDNDAKFRPLLTQAAEQGDVAAAGISDLTQHTVAPVIEAPPPLPDGIAELQAQSLAIGGSKRTTSRVPVEVIQRNGSLLAVDDLGNTVGELRAMPEPGGGFTVQEVVTGQQGTGAGRALYRKASELFGPYRGSTAQTPEGEGFVNHLRQTDPDIFRGGEAGFLGLGSKPKPPARPMDTLIKYEVTKEPIMVRARQFWDRWIDEMSNQEEPIPRRMRRAGMPDAAKFMEKMQARARGAGDMATGVANPITEGTYVYDAATQSSRRTGDGLSAVLGGIGKHVERDLNDYMAAGRHLELLARKEQAIADHAVAKLTGQPAVLHPDGKLKIDQAATDISRQAISDLGQRYGLNPDGTVKGLEQLAEGTREWSVRAVVDKLVEIGYVSTEDKAALLAKGEKYAPLFKLLDDLENSPDIVVGATNAKPIAKITSGLSKDHRVAPPLESFVDQAQKVTVWAERQRVRNLLGDLAEANPTTLGQEITRTPGKGDGTFPVYRNGKTYHYEAPRDVMQALKMMTPQQAGIIGQAAHFAARTLRAGATITLEFPFKNLFRDQTTAAVYGSEYKFRPVLDPLAGIFEQIPLPGRKGVGEYYKEWSANGGGMASLVSNDRTLAQLAVSDVTHPNVGARFLRNWKAEKNVFAKAFYPMLAPLEAMSNSLETATRVGGYRRARLAGATPLDAAVFSRDLTLDFARSGRFGQKWNSVEAFANASLQDTARFVKAYRQAPVRTTLAAGVFVVLPAVANWARWKDDPDYQALPEWERMSFLHIAKRDDGRWYRLPRPLGALNLAFSWGAHSFLDYLNETRPDAVQEILAGVTDQTPLQYVTDGKGINLTDAMPSIMQPGVEATMNSSRFTGRDIVPEGISENNPSEEQAFDTTTPLALNIGQAFGMSPIKVDYLIRGYGGTQGAMLAQGASQLMTDPTQLPELPTTAKDVPLVKGFVSSPAWGFGSDPVTKLYEASGAASAAKASWDAAIERGDALAASRIMRNHPEVELAEILEQAKRDIGDLRKTRKEIRSAPGLSKEDRMLQLLEIDQQATMQSAAAMDAYYQWLKGLRPDK